MLWVYDRLYVCNMISVFLSGLNGPSWPVKCGKLIRTYISTLVLGGCVITWLRHMYNTAWHGGLTAKPLRRRFDDRMNGGMCINTAHCVGYLTMLSISRLYGVRRPVKINIFRCHSDP
jgi:hypothetical protein